MITFGDGAHPTMVDLLSAPFDGGWIVEVLTAGQQPGDGVAGIITALDKAEIRILPQGPGAHPGSSVRSFSWTDVTCVHIY